MSNALYEGVSGLLSYQQMLDVVGNNLANVNTTGFKSGTVQFADLLYQTLAPATLSTTANSGTNPIQVGSGVKVGSIASNEQQGAISTTGNQFDLAIQGNGYFVANTGSQTLFTRAGSFGLDSNENLIDPATGYRIQRTGNAGEGNATSPAFQVPGDMDIKIPIGSTIPGAATTTVTLQGNLSAAASGPAAQVLTASSPFLSVGPPTAPADATTPLNSLANNTVPYSDPGTDPGDSLDLQGTAADGTVVNVTVPADSSTTLGDLVNDINSNFPGSTASISNGNLVVTSDTTGPSSLNLAISDVAGNTGSTTWGTQALQPTTLGKDGDTAPAVIQFFDQQGNSHNLNLTFQKQANNTWNLIASVPPADGTVISGTIQGITFNDNGSFQQIAGGGSNSISVQVIGMAAPQTIAFSMGSPNGFTGLTQFGGATSASATNQDGFAAGSLTSVSVAKDGTINGVFSNGQILTVAQVAIASFANPGGLSQEGKNYLSASAASGDPQIGPGQAGGRGSLEQGALESSNVDVATEFTRLLIAQQGYDVNSKTITVSNQMIQTLTNTIQ